MATLLQAEIDGAIEQLDRIRSLASVVESAGRMLVRTLTSDGKLLICGNGGSAADAMHMATEFVSRFSRERRGYPAMCLCASGSDLTAIGNDYAFDQAFARQVRAFARPEDCLIVISSSGNSRNIRCALETARQMGIAAVALLGRDGGFCKGIAQLDVIVPGDNTARIQEAQKVLIHTLCGMADEHLQA